MLSIIPKTYKVIHRIIVSITLNIRGKGFFNLLFVNFLTQFLSFGSVLLVAKFLSPTELGEIKIIQSYVGVFTIIASFGFNTAVLKMCSENRSEKEKSGILRLALGYAGISTIIALLLLVVLTLTGIITSLTKHTSYWLIVYACSIPMQVATAIFVVYLQAQKKIKEMAYSQAIIKIQTVLLIILCTWIWGFRGFVISTVITYALGLWPLLRIIGLNFLFTKVEVKTNLFFKYGLLSFLANGLYQMGLFSDIFVLDHFSADRDVIGYYALALIFIAAANQVTATVQSITTPYFSEHSQDILWFRKNLTINQLRMSLLSIVVAIGVYLIAWIFIPLLYGPDYSVTLQFLAILLLKYVLWSSCAVISTALLGIGLMHYNLIIVAIVTPVNFLFSYLFFQQSGIIGVAWAQVSATILLFIFLIIAGRYIIMHKMKETKSAL